MSMHLNLRLSECQNCSKTWADDELKTYIHHIQDRVEPGEPMPSGECPECGALCQPMDRLELLESLLESLEDTGESSDGGASYMVMGNVDTPLLKALGVRK